MLKSQLNVFVILLHLASDGSRVKCRATIKKRKEKNQGNVQIYSSLLLDEIFYNPKIVADQSSVKNSDMILVITTIL